MWCVLVFNVLKDFSLCYCYRSLATRGELVPIYQKAKEKAAEAEKRKKEKGKA